MYFFGAGTNCCGAIEFFGKENITAIIDNSTAKKGTFLMGIPIISLDDYLQQGNGEQIIVTVYLRSEEVACQLEQKGIHDYYICPFMQAGFYDCNTMIDKWKLDQYSTIGVYDSNPISKLLIQQIQSRQMCKVHYITEDEWKTHKLPKMELLLIVKEDCDTANYLGTYDICNIFALIENEKEEQYGDLKKFRNWRKGKKCVLVGNGPSLRESDLQRLYEKGIDSFGCNRIYLVFPKIDWRPDFYVISDNKVYEEVKDKLPPDLLYFISHFSFKQEKKKNEYNYTRIPVKNVMNEHKFSEDFVYGVYGGRTVMYDMLQIAVYMGYSEIYLIGVDCSWGEDGRNTHFYKESTDEDEMILKEYVCYKDEQKQSYVVAEEFAKNHGIKIYNATRGGHLEVFERVNFDEIF